MIRNPILKGLYLVIRGVPGFFFEHWITVHISNAKDRKSVPLTTPIKTGWVTKLLRPKFFVLKRSQVKVCV